MKVALPTQAKKYSVAIAILAIATILRFLLYPFLGEGVPFILYFPAIVVCAWYGGVGPGLLATALSAMISWYYFLLPTKSFALVPADFGKLVLFISAGVLISFFAGSLQQLKKKAEESERKEREQRIRFHVTLSSIGDAVIATDTEGIVTFINPVAESLTGWKAEDAYGKPLEQIFQIVNEQSREPVQNPAIRAIREGLIFGLANHTILISKDQSEHPIEDSGAPIKDPDGIIHGAVLIFRDISEQRKANEQQALMSNIVESSDDAIIAKNLQGIITSWNLSAEKMFGYTADEVIGKSITIIIPEDRLEEEREILDRLRKGERMEHFETIRVSKTGELLNISLTVSPIRDSTGRIIGASKVARDITSRKQSEAALAQLLEREQAARASAENANRTKDEFLATVSHELRTPLNAIFGWVGLLKMGTLDSDASKRGVDAIQQSSKALSRLVEDLLDVSRITSGKFQMNTESVDLVQIIKATLEIVGPAVRAKSIHLETRLDPSAAAIMGDSTRLQQVIWNLLSNAVKFTPSNGRVEIKLERFESQAQIQVTDTGKGINQSFLPFLFEPFWQADSKDTRKHRGLGLGLAIVRHLVELHGGTVQAHSDGDGLGATFTVRIPMKAVQIQSVDQIPDLMSRMPKLQGVKVLLVDDEKSARDVVSAVLSSCGAEVTTAASANEALEKLKSFLPDILISDIAMAEQNGYDLIAKVRRLKPEEGGAIPAIALTAFSTTEDRLRALAAGFQTHVPKPVEPAELALVIARLVPQPKAMN